MKKIIFVILLVIFATISIFVTSCGNSKSSAKITFIPGLIVNINSYVNTKVETEGVIAHVCGVDRKKMKLMSENGEVVVVVPYDTTSFDYSLNKKRIKVYGLVKEERIDNSYLDEKEEEKVLLCHVDHTPCKDTEWINAKIEAGVADTLSKQQIEARRKKMEQQNKGYISIVTIVCEKYKIVSE